MSAHLDIQQPETSEAFQDELSDLALNAVAHCNVWRDMPIAFDEHQEREAIQKQLLYFDAFTKLNMRADTQAVIDETVSMIKERLTGVFDTIDQITDEAALEKERRRNRRRRDREQTEDQGTTTG